MTKLPKPPFSPLLVTELVSDTERKSYTVYTLENLEQMQRETVEACAKICDALAKEEWSIGGGASRYCAEQIREIK